ncbi:unnamed protein product, partial [Polarella glacialis]
MCRVFYATQLGQGVKRSMLDILAPLHGAIFEFMCLQDLAMLQATCGDLWQLLEHEADSAWLSSTASVLPGFELDPSALFHARRADFLKLLPHLKDTVYSGDAGTVAALPQVRASMALSRASRPQTPRPIRLAGLAEATRLSQRLATARTTAGQHLASGGAYAEVLMVHLALAGPPAGNASSLSFFAPAQLPQVIPKQACWDSRGSAGSAPLRLYFACRRGKLLLSLRDDDAAAESIPLQ